MQASKHSLLAECAPACHTRRRAWDRRKAPARGVGRLRGLLDSYRQEQGITSDSQKVKAPKRVRHPRSVDNEPKEDTLCTPDCVRKISTASEFEEVLSSTPKETLVVVDFYKTACGSCRYIQPGFVKLCHNLEEEHAPVVFLKHNVIDEADQETDLSEKLKIRNVPLFQFYREHELLEQFATRDKARIGNAINRHVGQDICHF